MWLFQPIPAAGSSASGFVAAWGLNRTFLARRMKKNVASQAVGIQMISATDGSAFTGAVTVAVTGDAGTQATGSVGSGACTHEGNGYHTYAPAQAETNYDQIGFTFTGTGAIPATLVVYTTFPQTGDSFARIGAPVGASISADIAGVQSDTDNIQTRIPAALVGGRMDSNMQAAANGVITAAVIATDAIDADAIAADAVTEIQSGLSTLTQANIRTAVGLATNNLDTQLGAIDDFIDTEVAAIKTETDKIASIKTETDKIAAVKAKTDSLTFTVANNLDANIQYVNDTQIQGTGAVGTDEWRKV